MKALSIRMPWAYLCARGIKTIENRTWTTKYRGRFYIHAGQKFDNAALEDWRLKKGGLIDVKVGIHISMLILYWNRGIAGIIGEATLVKIIKKSSSPWFDGPFGYCLADAKLYPFVMPCKGRQGFFEPVFLGGNIDLAKEIEELEEGGVKL
jgi:hypothetical protein